MTRPPVTADFESGFPSPRIVDSRRLMGPNLMHAGVGAVVDVLLDDSQTDGNGTLLAAWHARVSQIAAALGWPDADTVQRQYPGGASLFVNAPVDQLMTATDVCESAWVHAEATAAERDAGDAASIAALRVLAEAEARPTLMAVWNAAQMRGLNVTFDESTVAIGTGIGAQCWPIDELPAVDAIDWSVVRDIPIVLVTGSNGKTTVVRMVAAMARAEGHVVGHTCTDGVWIGDAQVESGDWSGPVGARRVLQDPSVTLAVLETARGGILRRGLAIQRASVAAIVTLSPDHFGEYGIIDLATLADAKLVVGRAVSESGVLVYNATIPALVDAMASYRGRVAPVACDTATLARAGFNQMPAALGGTAAHNLLNATIAAAIARELRLGPAADAALLRFGAGDDDNVGRLMVRKIGTVTVVVDYAHNAQGVAALIEATRHIPATRRAIALGTGGDRDDVALHAIAKAAFDSGVIDFYIAKEMPKFLRGRAAGSISGVLLHALRALGVHDAQLISAPDDLSAAELALEWAQDGDLILLATHDQREAVLALLAARAQASSASVAVSNPHT